MDQYQKKSHLFFVCSVHDAKTKYNFSQEQIEPYIVRLGNELSEVVEIPINTFEFNRNELEMGGATSSTTDKMRQYLNHLMEPKSFGRCQENKSLE